MYSWITPIKNEAESLPQLLSEIKKVMMGKSYEVIAVNDASSDDSLEVLKNLSPHHPHLTTQNSPSHIGKWRTLETGFQQSKGDIIITSDSDLQDNPKEVGKLLKKLESGYDLVSGWRYKREDTFYKIFLSNIGSSIFGFKDINSPFKVYKREVFARIPKEGSLLRFSPFFAIKMGYKVTEVKIDSRKRFYGKSKFGFIKYLRIIYDAVLLKLLFTGSNRLKYD